MAQGPWLFTGSASLWWSYKVAGDGRKAYTLSEVFDLGFMPRSPTSQMYMVVLNLQAASFLRHTQPSKFFAFSLVLASSSPSNAGVMSQPF